MNCSIDISIEDKQIGITSVLLIDSSPSIEIELLDEQEEQMVEVGISPSYGQYLHTRIVDALPAIGDPSIIYQLRRGNDEYSEYMYTEGYWNIIGQEMEWNEMD